jgi:hypothetical protein
MRCDVLRTVFAFAATFLSGCGGGGGGLASIPTPPTSGGSTANTSTAVELFPNPATQEFATVGSGSPLRVRYDATSAKYEVNTGSGQWSVLIDDPSYSPLPGSPNVEFMIGGGGHVSIRVHYAFPPEFQYRYSNLAVWGGAPGANGQAVGGLTAIGIPTAAANVPRAGSASYQGLIEGGSTVLCNCGWDVGEKALATVGGSASLTFDFGQGTLSGALHPYLDAEKRYDLGTLGFANTVFGVGSQTFSGTFASNLTGPNAFSGMFTGPNAQELIGNWSFPFTYPLDGSLQSATGAMIAKRP